MKHLASLSGTLALFAALLLGAPQTADAQDTRVPRAMKIGRLSPLSAPADAPNLQAFREGLREFGWVEGRDYVVTPRFADGRADRLAALAAELVRERVDVILVGSNPGAAAAKAATETIPIVMVTTADPVAGKLVASLAQPGGNLTGVTALGQALDAKRLELLKETLPGVTRVAVLANPASPYTAPFLNEREALARAVGVQLTVHEVGDPARLSHAFAAMTNDRNGALMVLTDLSFINQRTSIVDIAARSRLPAMYGEREFVHAGGLMFYGASLTGMYHRSAYYVDRILKGTKPTELPIEQPTKFELVINIKTARALQLEIPRSILVRADELLQ